MREVRRLAIFCAGFALAVFAAHYLLPTDSLPTAALLCALLSLCGFAFKGRARKRVLLTFLALTFGFLWYNFRCETVLAPCGELSGEPVTVTASVTGYPKYGEYCSYIYLRFTDESVPHVKGAVYAYEGELDSLHPGDIIKLTMSLRPGAVSSGEYSDTNISKGLYLVGNLKGDVEITGQRRSSLPYLPQELAHSIRQKLSELFPEDVRGFVLALLTGEKSEYYLNEELSTAITVSGISHVVAVSGMHVAFLLGFLQLILGKNRRSSLICLVLIWLFVLMTGASPSAVRAGFMQSLLLAAPLFMRVPDRATGLALALAVILLVNPFAAGNAGLQLSFAAIAGIYCFAEPINSALRKRLRIKSGFAADILTYAVGVFSSSVSVLVFTVPILALQYGSVQILGTAANLLCIWAVSAVFCMGFISCALGFISAAAGKLFARLTAFIVRYIVLVAKTVAKLPFAVIYTENRLCAAWIILCYLLFAICFMLRGREKPRPAVPAALSALSLAAVLIISRCAVMQDTGTVTVLDVGSGQCAVLTDKKNCVVIDCGGSGTDKNAGDAAAEYILGNGRNRIDCLVLTHLHSDHANGAVKLMSRVRIGRLLLPTQSGEDTEAALYREITALAEKNGTDIEYIDENKAFRFGGLGLRIYAPMEKGGKNERCLMLTAEAGGKNVLITGDANITAERELIRREDVSDTDILIAGHHGAKTSCSQELLNEARPEKAVISVGYNSYGHPTNTVLARLRAYGAEIFRTDLMGRVTIR